MNEPNTEATLLWHYTTGQNFIEIVRSGVLLPATAYIEPGERAAVWFSRNQHWEETANKGWVEAGVLRTLTRDETRVRGGGLVRFGVEPGVARHGWKAYVRKSRVNWAVATGLAKRAREVGADPDDWYVSFKPVPRDQWAAVEVWDEAEDLWVRVHGNRPTDEAVASCGRQPSIFSSERSA